MEAECIFSLSAPGLAQAHGKRMFAPGRAGRGDLRNVVIPETIFIEDFLCVRCVLGPGIEQNRKYAPRATEQIL